MASASHISTFVDRIGQQLDELASLPANWDGEGAPIIDRAILQAARQFIADLPDGIAELPLVVPSAAGNLQFEWSDGNRSLELEIESPSTIHYLKWQPKEEMEQEDVFDIRDVEQAACLIRWFMRGSADV